MAKRICTASWVARYDEDGDIDNFREIRDARSRALNEGCAYLVKILFIDDPDVIVEEAFADETDALEWAKLAVEPPTAVKAVVVCLMNGSDIFGDGYKRYHSLTSIETFYNRAFYNTLK